MKKQIFKTKIQVVILGLLLIPLSAYGQSDDAVSLDMLIDEAKKNNPQIQEAYNKWRAAEHKIKSVKSLPDPVAGVTLPGEHVQTRVGPQERKYSFSQKVPFPNKLRLKGKAQEKQAQMLKEKYEATINEVIKEVKFAYYDLFWVDQAIQINEEEKSILERVEKVAQRKYESNLILQQDVIKVQVELSKIIQKLFLLRQSRKSLSAKLNALLNRSQDADIGKILNIEDYEFRDDLEGILHKTKNSRQELIAAQLSVEKARYEKSLAKMAYLPDFTFGAEYIEVGSGMTSSVDDGQDAWMGMISVNVPIWFGKLKAQVNETEKGLQAALKSQESIENDVIFEAQDLYFKINTYKDIVLLYETALLPQAQQAFDSSQTGFETGSVSFLDWLDTERTFLQTRLAYYKAITDYHKSIASLDRVVGEYSLGGENEK